MTNNRAPKAPARDPTTIEAPPVNGATPELPAGPEAEGEEPEGAAVVSAVVVG